MCRFKIEVSKVTVGRRISLILLLVSILLIAWSVKTRLEVPYLANFYDYVYNTRRGGRLEDTDTFLFVFPVFCSLISFGAFALSGSGGPLAAIRLRWILPLAFYFLFFAAGSQRLIVAASAFMR